MSNIKEVGLFPTSRENRDAIRTQLAISKVFDDGFFTPFGTFYVRDDINRITTDFMMTTSIDMMWSPELLGLDSEKLKLRVNRAGNVIVMDAQGDAVKTIDPLQIRPVCLPKHQLVGESGYLLTGNNELVGNQALNTSKLEELLIQAERGVKLRGQLSDDRYFAVKVEPNLKGRRLLRFDLRYLRPEPEWFKDAVIIDPETNQVVPRRIYHPFASHRWDYRIQTPAIGERG